MDSVQAKKRLLYVEPTLINDINNEGRSYTSPLEDYCIGVDLEMYYTERDACGYGEETGKIKAKNVNVSFFNGTDGNLTTNYTDVSMITPWDNTSECIGIKSISINYNEEMYPMITIVFTDVRGASLIGPTEMESNYEAGDGSFFNMLYSMPSPRFKLKIKGFYGNGVSYDLVMQKSSLSFDAGTGNFDIRVDFMGYMYGIYADLPMTYLSLAPFMGSTGTRYWETQVNNGRFVFYNGEDKVIPMKKLTELRLAIAKAAESEPVKDMTEEEERNKKDYLRRTQLIRNMIMNYPFKKWDVNSHSKYAFFITEDSQYFNQTKTKATHFNSALENYNDFYDDSPIFGYSNMSEIVKNNKIKQITFVKKDGTYMVSKKTTEYEALENILRNKIKGNSNKIFVICCPIGEMKNYGTDVLDNLINTLDEQRRKDELEYSKSKKQAIANAMGFPTTIKNMYELILAHMETFIMSFYEYLDEIRGDDQEYRRPEHYFIGRGDTDCVTDIMPPFPGIYADKEASDGTKKKEMIWPGSLTNGGDLAEVRLVEEVLQAAHFYSQAQSAIDADIRAENWKSDTPNLEDYDLSSNDSDDAKLAIYITLKRLYEKWICSGKKEQWKIGNSLQSQSNNFIYIDSFYHNIGNRFVINMDKVSALLARYMPTSFDHEKDKNYSVYNFIYEIANDNGAMLMCFPFSFDYTLDSMRDMFIPKAWNNITIDDKSTFVLLYPYERSKSLNTNSGFDDDTFNLVEENGILSDTLPESLLDEGRYIGAFGVSYGRQNQGFFKNLNLNMNNPKMTEAAIEGAMNLVNANGQGIREGVLYGQDIYKSYSNYSFEASLETMGNAQIMPLMYFQLNGIPMWRGTYMIKKVSHEIVPGNMTTSFSGYRISKNSIPLVDTDLSFITTTDMKVEGEGRNNRFLTPTYNIGSYGTSSSSAMENVRMTNVGWDGDWSSWRPKFMWDGFQTDVSDMWKGNNETNFQEALKKILFWEGGWYDGSKSGDPNPTNKGITLNTYRSHFGASKTANDLKGIKDSEVEKIYKEGFWDKVHGDDLNNQSIAELLFDMGINCGVGTAAKMIQSLVGVTADGRIGTETVAAINSFEPQEELWKSFKNKREAYYRDLAKRKPEKRKFLNGWLNRLNSYTYEG